MKIFKLNGSMGDGYLDRRFGLYKVLFIGPEKETKESFSEKASQISDELKKKYNVDDKNIPLLEQRSRKQIIDEAAKLLCERFGFELVSIEGEYTIGGFGKDI